MKDTITRRDFVDGVACAIAAGLTPASAWAQAAGHGPYPPGEQGMRGSRNADAAAAHAVRDGAKYRIADYPIDEQVDAVVIGAGIGGLAAAHYLHQALPKARLLILDNHDEFGGHARRNEFTVDGRQLIGYGGSESIQSPGTIWSPVALKLLADLGIHLQRFQSAIDTPLYPGLGLSTGVFFPRESYGHDKLVTGDPQRSLPTDIPAALHHGRPITQFAADCPLSESARRDLIALFSEPRDVLHGLATAKKLELLGTTTYHDFLVKHWKLDPSVVRLFDGRSLDLFSAPATMLPALLLADTGYPGFQGLNLGKGIDLREEAEPYIYHFPDGNASIARLLVRRMIPQVAPGNTMEDIVTARFDYEALDRAPAPVRLRLSSTVVGLQNADGHVDVLTMRAGKLQRVRARKAIYAGYYTMLPYICADLPAAQRNAVASCVRSPLVVTNVAIRNWRAWVKMGVHLVNNPLGFYCVAKLDYPVSLGRYRFAKTPDEPMLLHLSHIPQPAAPIADVRESMRAARRVLYARPFADFENAARTELTRILGPGGFNADRDIAAITVNRWGHGYAFPLQFVGEEVAKVARQPIGGISVAGSDAAWTAYAHAAIDEAHRAAAEAIAGLRRAAA